MSIYYEPGAGAIVATVDALDAAAPGSIIATDDVPRFGRFLYVKEESGRWSMRHARHTPAAWLLDPEHSAQPIRWVEKR